MKQWSRKTHAMRREIGGKETEGTARTGRGRQGGGWAERPCRRAGPAPRLERRRVAGRPRPVHGNRVPEGETEVRGAGMATGSRHRLPRQRLVGGGAARGPGPGWARCPPASRPALGAGGTCVLASQLFKSICCKRGLMLSRGVGTVGHCPLHHFLLEITVLGFGLACPCPLRNTPHVPKASAGQSVLCMQPGCSCDLGCCAPQGAGPAGPRGWGRGACPGAARHCGEDGALGHTLEAHRGQRPGRKLSGRSVRT